MAQHSTQMIKKHYDPARHCVYYPSSSSQQEWQQPISITPEKTRVVILDAFQSLQIFSQRLFQVFCHQTEDTLIERENSLIL
jgi:hypothetical protein